MSVLLRSMPRSLWPGMLLAVEILPAARQVRIGRTGVYVDRFVSMPVAYPANYGSSRAASRDGDPSMHVLTRAPLIRRAVAFRPVRRLRMRDGASRRHIIGVRSCVARPLAMCAISATCRGRAHGIEAFFRVYKLCRRGVARAGRLWHAAEPKGWSARRCSGFPAQRTEGCTRLVGTRVRPLWTPSAAALRAGPCPPSLPAVRARPTWSRSAG